MWLGVSKSIQLVKIVHTQNNISRRYNKCGEHEAVGPVRTRFWRAKPTYCGGESLCGKKFPLKLKGTFYKSYEKPANLCDT